MATPDDTIKALEEALRCSPDNLPLRRHFASTLLGLGQPEEAERQYRLALAKWPQDADLKLGLASAFHQQGKSKEAAVLLEGLVREDEPPARAHLLLARILLPAGEVEEAVRQYRKAVSRDPSAADPDLAARLGVRDEAPASDDSDGESYEDEVVDGRVRAAAGDGPGGAAAEVERPKVSFKEVGGMDSVKEEIRMKIIHPLTHADLYQAYGKAIGGGILMYGPPGCGKTHLARATAGEIKAGFLAVGINDVLDMWIGNSERNLHEIFEQARRNKPCVLFFDEVDALGASRSDLRHSAGRQLINQFLAELDGVQAVNDGVLILAATNAPWHLDSAFRRPGRFDRILFVPPPDAAARAAILRIQLRGKPVEEIDYDGLARKTDGLSGADLKALVDVAIEGKLRDAMREGIPKPLVTKDLLAAAKGVRPSTREWFSTARNHALYANQGGVYDDILKFLKL